MFRKILWAFLAAMTLTGSTWAEPAPTPESHLLLPFFEVSLDGFDRMTFFAIANASDDELFLTAKIYSNWAVKMLEVEFSVKAKEVRSINLHDWIISGKLPGGVKVCPGGGSECMDQVHLRTALAGQPSLMTQLYYGQELEPGVATGFVTIEADGGFLPESDVLWGDYFYTNPEENFAQGQRLVRLEPDLSCADLCLRHSIRFLEGGGFSGGTKLTVWNWDGIERGPSEFPVPDFELENAHIDVYSQSGELVDVLPQLKVLPVQTLLVSELDIRKDFGWLDLSTFQHSSVSGYYRAMGRFSVGVPSWCLPCDPCNENGPCYEPGNPSCNTTPCITPRLTIEGDKTAQVGVDFLLTYDFAGTPPLNVTITQLPPGVIHSGNSIFGKPTAPREFVISVQNDCGSDRHRVVFTDTPESYLTLIKTVVNDHGGTATVADFPLFANGLPFTSGQRVELAPGTYQASEHNLPGYTPGSWTGDCAADGTVTLNAGDDKVCHITNDDTPARLTLIKQVINDDGGTAQPGDFPLFVGGQPVTTGVAVELAAGTYTASEQNIPDEYTALPWTGDCAGDGTVTLELGDDKTCVITNDDNDDSPQPSFLTLVKTVINDDGGTAQANDFNLHFTSAAVGRVNVTSGVRNPVAEGTIVVGEDNLPGYSAGTWGGDCAADGTVVIEEGDDKVCTITNDDIPATVTLVKHVVNDDGGTARVSDFQLSIGGRQVTSGVAVELPAGTYAASEQNLPGYAAGAWRGDCAADGSVTLALGENKVCEITNDDASSTITLIKHVVNDHGGTASAVDFQLSVGGRSVTSGQAVSLPPGNYVASEQNLPGYDAGSWGGDCAADGSVTLGLGEHKICEITNFDKPSTITLVKHVVNDHGGTAGVHDFALSISGRPASSGVAVELEPGTYTAGEQNLPGYTAGSWGGDCAADGSVTLGLGEHKVCEITNDDKPSTITLVKHVINHGGGTAGVHDFALSISGRPATSGVAVELAPGNYVASEQNLTDYVPGTWGGDCASNGSVTLGLGEHKVCEITNTYDPPCDPTPSLVIWNAKVDYNSPHRDYHHTEVRFNFRVDGELDGEVQIFWQNGSSTFVKKRKSISLDCEDPAYEGGLFWDSDAKSHHPGHGARYSARLVVNGQVVQSIPLN